MGRPARAGRAGRRVGAAPLSLAARRVGWDGSGGCVGTPPLHPPRARCVHSIAGQPVHRPGRYPAGRAVWYHHTPPPRPPHTPPAAGRRLFSPGRAASAVAAPSPTAADVDVAVPPTHPPVARAARPVPVPRSRAHRVPVPRSRAPIRHHPPRDRPARVGRGGGGVGPSRGRGSAPPRCVAWRRQWPSTSRLMDARRLAPGRRRVLPLTAGRRRPSRARGRAGGTGQARGGRPRWDHRRGHGHALSVPPPPSCRSCQCGRRPRWRGTRAAAGGGEAGGGRTPRRVDLPRPSTRWAG